MRGVSGTGIEILIAKFNGPVGRPAQRIKRAKPANRQHLYTDDQAAGGAGATGTRTEAGRIGERQDADDAGGGVFVNEEPLDVF
jgi:hypothetical protein